MKFNRMFPTLTLAATACAFGVAPVASASAATDVQQASSENWSGYVVGDSDQSTTYKTVTGSWVQPAATCTRSGASSYAAFWVGLGGADGKTALEQDGTEVNCSADGKASYYAWYELVPKAPVQVDLAVHPGDHMTATTTVDGHNVTESIENTTTGQSFSKTLTMSNPDTTSAEWVAEAPSQCQGSVSNCTALPLADFKRVTFTNASATDSNGHSGSISDAAWQTAALTLTPGASSMGGGATGFVSGQYPTAATSSGSASPTSLGDGGSSFAVTYRRAASAESTSGSASDGGYGSGGYAYGSGGGYGATSGYGNSGYGYGDGGYGYPGYGASGDGYATTGGYGDGGYIVIYAY